MCSQHIMHDIACTFHLFVSFWFIFSISMIFIIPLSSTKLRFCQLWCVCVCVLWLWTLELSVLLELSMKVCTLFSCPCISLAAVSILLNSCINRRKLFLIQRNSNDPNLTSYYKRYCRILTNVFKLAKKNTITTF